MKKIIQRLLRKKAVKPTPKTQVRPATKLAIAYDEVDQAFFDPEVPVKTKADPDPLNPYLIH